jgi:hypothetical protein
VEQDAASATRGFQVATHRAVANNAKKRRVFTPEAPSIKKGSEPFLRPESTNKYRVVAALNPRDRISLSRKEIWLDVNPITRKPCLRHGFSLKFRQRYVGVDVLPPCTEHPV